MNAPSPAKKLTARKLEREIARIASTHLVGKQISVLDIPKVFRAGEEAYATAQDLGVVESAVIATIEVLTRKAEGVARG